MYPQLFSFPPPFPPSWSNQSFSLVFLTHSISFFCQFSRSLWQVALSSMKGLAAQCPYGPSVPWKEVLIQSLGDIEAELVSCWQDRSSLFWRSQGNKWKVEERGSSVLQHKQQDKQQLVSMLLLLQSISLVTFSSLALKYASDSVLKVRKSLQTGRFQFREPDVL